MMKQAIVLALLTLSAPMAPLDGDVVTWFWQFLSVPIQDPILAMLPIRPNETQSIGIGYNQSGLGTPDRAWSPMLPILAMTSWDLRIDISQKNVENVIFRFFAECPWEPGSLGVPEKEQKQTKTSGRFPDLKIFSGTNVLMIRDSVLFVSFGGNYKILVETNIFWWKLFWWKLFFWLKSLK
jgi:hypothetical protein